MRRRFLVPVAVLLASGCSGLTGPLYLIVDGTWSYTETDPDVPDCFVTTALELDQEIGSFTGSTSAWLRQCRSGPADTLAAAGLYRVVNGTVGFEELEFDVAGPGAEWHFTGRLVDVDGGTWRVLTIEGTRSTGTGATRTTADYRMVRQRKS